VTNEEALQLFDGLNCVELADGKLGLWVRCANKAGVQVPGEPDLRWIEYPRLIYTDDGAFIEAPA